ncbi:hypothetical protein ACL02S_17580 [Nocardia sp. 004]|uniref:hypothetical protein n=1 Tax=Nocardia sp. 004 TaxID=3385978 RepID=UPI0039A1E61C
MLEPNGPLPPEIYWRRRALAVGILVIILALVVWLVLVIAGGDDTPDEATAAGSTSSSAVEPSATEDDSDTPEPPAVATGVVAAEPCPDQSLAIKVTVEQPTYRLGERPVFGIVITNISTVTCTRDMGSGLQHVSVYTLDGRQRLWSSADCYPDGNPDVRTMNRGEQAAFTVTWSGSTSRPGCAGERVQVPPGAYNVVAQLGTVRSAAEPFNLA